MLNPWDRNTTNALLQHKTISKSHNQEASNEAKIMPKPAMAECYMCHFRFPKPEMKKINISQSNTTFSFSPSGKTSGRTSVRSKTVFVCQSCSEKRIAKIISFAWLIFTFIVILLLVWGISHVYSRFLS